MDDDEVRSAEDREEHGLEGGDHHLVDGAGDEHEQHAVGEVLREVGDGPVLGAETWGVGRGWVAAGHGPVVLPSVLNSHLLHHLRCRPVDVGPVRMTL